MLINGKGYWTKIVGKPVPGYEKTELEWSFDLAQLTKETQSELKKVGLGKYLKDKEDERGVFIHLRRKAVKRDGTPATPIRIVDHRNQPWAGGLIGNGSTLNVNVAINEFDKKLSVSPVSVQVWDHVQYQPKNDFPVREDDEATVEIATKDTKEW